MTWKKGFIESCKHDLEKLREQLEPLESGRSHIGHRPPGGQWKDITYEEIEKLKQSIANLERLIGELEALPDE